MYLKNVLFEKCCLVPLFLRKANNHLSKARLDLLGEVH